MTSEYWKHDRLDRRRDADFLYNFLLGQHAKRKARGHRASYVLNVDADWGGGKSFFLEGLALDIEENGHLVARINAWKDDHASDPYVAIMAAIDKAFAPFVAKTGTIKNAWNVTKQSGGPIALRIGGAIIKGLAKKHVGIDFEDLAALVDIDDELGDITETALSEGAAAATKELDKLFDSSLDALIKGFQKTDHAMVDFRAKLANAISSIDGEKKAPFFIVVDELDRCRPTYAVALLERVKHLFDVDGIIFVFATNSDQLQHSISGAYGPNFNGFRYLKRFFERTYVFERPTIDRLVESLVAHLPNSKLKAPDDALAETIARGCDAFGFDLRAVEHVVDMIDCAVTAWAHELPADIVLLFALCAHFYQTGKAEWPSNDIEALRRWELRRMGHNYEGRRTDKTISMREIYAYERSIFTSMQEMMENAGRGNRDDPAAEYVNQVLTPEWNGKMVDRNRPSIQTELLGLVANAGRMLSRDEQRAHQ
ncbi:KAP family NTPase [Rhizobium changzhiense]|uniref:KAP family P-loop NTPase fold protein n=1 Tax=Rhizobium changzhiense TaxID=2692317 RepID=UPI001F0BA12A|nr:P-loop NTPase fold protein [Rhizobium changzhiense]MCH4545925.1 KAP family NTPase [Rhizobium changzhiense]